MHLGWGQENPAFRQVFTSLFIPGGSAEQMQWLNDLQRKTTSPDNAARIRTAMNDIDVTDLLTRVTAPTLVLHCRDDAVAPFEEGRRMAAGIRGSRFVALEGRNHMILESDPDWRRFLDEVGAFLKT
jgi:pimeloyl-ACP methyl ester carboxylesterase